MAWGQHGIAVLNLRLRGRRRRRGVALIAVMMVHRTLRIGPTTIRTLIVVAWMVLLALKTPGIRRHEPGIRSGVLSAGDIHVGRVLDATSICNDHRSVWLMLGTACTLNMALDVAVRMLVTIDGSGNIAAGLPMVGLGGTTGRDGIGGLIDGDRHGFFCRLNPLG